MNPYTLVTPITQIVREMSVEQPVEHAATLEDIRAEVLTPDRLNTVVFGSFAAVALAIAVVGVAGVLAFSVSGRIREFGIRLALGAQPKTILSGVVIEGVLIAAIGVAAGALVGFALSRLAGSYVAELRLPDALPLIGSAAVILVSAVVASVVPAARAARVDTVQALRAD
jgi:putative ABC transport system permease protein